MKMLATRNVAAWVALAVTASGCSMFEGKKIDYKSAGKLPTLEAPPDLVMPAGDNRFACPTSTPRAPPLSPPTTATAAASRKRLARKPCCPRSTRSASNVPAASAGWSCKRPPRSLAGGQRLLAGTRLHHHAGIARSWIDGNRLGGEPRQIAAGWHSRLSRQGAGQLLFHCRARQIPHPPGTAADGRTEIYLSHRGMVEVFEGTQGGGDQGQGRTIWQPRPANPELEAEMLRR
jgi:outer membrane protein assembly factor BamC